MNASVECQVCRREIPLRSAVASEPWPVSISCPHCGSRYGLKRSSSWRWFWLVAPIVAGVCAMAAFALLTMAAGRLAGVVGAVAGFGGLVAVLSLAMWSQKALLVRLYRRSAFELLPAGAVAKSATAPQVSCGACGRIVSIPDACCPMCGAALPPTPIDPIVCSACREHVRIVEICCPACGVAVGRQVKA